MKVLLVVLFWLCGDISGEVDYANFPKLCSKRVPHYSDCIRPHLQDYLETALKSPLDVPPFHVKHPLVDGGDRDIEITSRQLQLRCTKKLDLKFVYADPENLTVDFQIHYPYLKAISDSDIIVWSGEEVLRNISRSTTTFYFDVDINVKVKLKTYKTEGVEYFTVDDLIFKSYVGGMRILKLVIPGNEERANEVTDYINAHPSKSASLITPANDSGASGYLKKLLSEMLGEVPANKLLPED